MTDCLFCKIVDKKIPAEVIYEDESYLAFLDIRPLSPGHSLLIPKEHYRWVWDLPNLGEFFETAKKIVVAQRQAFKTESVWAKIIGDEVPHAHLWLFPRPTEQSFGRANPKEVTGDKMALESHAAAIRQHLS